MLQYRGYCWGLEWCFWCYCIAARCRFRLGVLVSHSTRCRTGAGCFMKLNLHLCMVLLFINNALVIPPGRVPAASNSRGPGTPPVRVLGSTSNKGSCSSTVEVLVLPPVRVPGSTSSKGSWPTSSKGSWPTSSKGSWLYLQ